jgi:hypothetical protein
VVGFTDNRGNFVTGATVATLYLMRLSIDAGQGYCRLSVLRQQRQQEQRQRRE